MKYDMMPIEWPLYPLHADTLFPLQFLRHPAAESQMHRASLLNCAICIIGLLTCLLTHFRRPVSMHSQLHSALRRT